MAVRHGIAGGTADRADLVLRIGRSRRQAVNGHEPRIGEQPGVLPGAGRAACAERRGAHLIAFRPNDWTDLLQAGWCHAQNNGSGGCDDLWIGLGFETCKFECVEPYTIACKKRGRRVALATDFRKIQKDAN